MSATSSTLKAWQRVSPYWGGKWLFSKIIGWKVPYFASIRPQIKAIQPGYCEIHLKKRRAVTNHLGTVHAIAMCNLAEITGGLAGEATLPASHRWIPKSMEVEYLKKAGSNLRAFSRLTDIPDQLDNIILPVEVEIFDTAEQMVFRAKIKMWVTAKKSSNAAKN